MAKQKHPLFLVHGVCEGMGDSTIYNHNIYAKDAFGVKKILLGQFEGQKIEDLEEEGDAKCLRLSFVIDVETFEYDIQLCEEVTEKQQKGYLTLVELKKILEKNGLVQNLEDPILLMNDNCQLTFTLSEKRGERDTTMTLLWDGFNQKLVYDLSFFIKGELPGTPRMLGEKVLALRNFIRSQCL